MGYQDDANLSLLAATQELTNKVDRLTDTVTITSAQSKRTRILMFFVLFLSLCAIVEGIFTIKLVQKSQHAIDLNSATQVTNCQNANESRAASTKLWNFVIDISERGEHPNADLVQLEKIRTWINVLYQPHDCSQLSKKYPLPDPPPLLRGQSL